MENTMEAKTEDDATQMRTNMSKEMYIGACLERAFNTKGHYVVNGKIKPNYNWILDEGVTACEMIRGTNIEVIIKKKKILTAETRRAAIDPYGKDPNALAISFSMDTNLLTGAARKGSAGTGYVVVGTVPYTKRWHAEQFLNSISYFIPRAHQYKRMKFGQWGKHPITVDNIRNWLREDLYSRLPEYLAAQIGCGKPTCHKDSEDPQFFRPYGILLRHPEGMLARITCDMFDFYYEEGLGQARKQRKANSMTAEKWASLSEAEKEQVRANARQPGRPQSAA